MASAAGTRALLSEDQRLVIRLAGDGLMVAGSSRRLGVSESTIRYRRSRAMRVLGARNITHAYTLAHRRGLL